MFQFEPKYGEFYKDLTNQINQYFKENNLSKSGNLLTKIQFFAVWSVLILSWLVLFVLKPHLWVSIWFYPVIGLCVGNLCLFGHDAVHNTFAKNKFLNKLAKYSLNFLGGNSDYYYYKHSIHHAYTNILGLDDDVNFRPFLRTNQSDKYHFWHKFQHFYSIFLYLFVAFFLIFDFSPVSKKVSQNNTKPFTFKKLTKFQTFLFWFSKIWHIAIFFVIPGLIVGFGWIIGGYLLMMGTCGLYLGFLVQPSHIFSESIFWDFPENKTDNEWAKIITSSTANYNTKSGLMTYFSGGMNFHVVHSLLPHISFVHYPHLNPIVMQTCQKYGFSYNEFPTLRSAVYSHIKQLQKMSKK